MQHDLNKGTEIVWDITNFDKAYYILDSIEKKIILVKHQKYTQSFYSGSDLPAQCSASKYKVLDQADRNQNKGGNKYADREKVTYGDAVQSPQWLGEGWYRITGSAGTRISESKPDKNSCGTWSPGYITDIPKIPVGETNDVKICFHWMSEDCHKSVPAKITNCRSFNVYYLPDAPNGYYRYCTSGIRLLYLSILKGVNR